MEDFTRITISDEFMKERLSLAKSYTLMILKDGPNRGMEGERNIIWEHGRRNFALREAGLMPIVCPVGDNSPVCGIGIFALGPEEVKKICDEDPGVRAGIFVYELHPCRGFPGSRLP